MNMWWEGEKKAKNPFFKKYDISNRFRGHASACPRTISGTIVKVSFCPVSSIPGSSK